MNTLVLFDVDKTLIRIDTSEHRDAFHAAILKVYGVHANMADVPHDGMTDRQILIEVLRRKGLADAEIRRSMSECTRLMGEIFEANGTKNARIALLHGVRELLSALERHGVLVGLVTGNVDSIAAAKLRAVGIREHFKPGGFGNFDEVRANLVRMAVSSAVNDFGFDRSGRVFVIGDTPRDIAAGRGAGAATIGVATGNYSEAELKAAGADFTLRDLSDTAAALSIILGQSHGVAPQKP